MTDEETFEGWAILELMGHRRLGGFLREQTIAGAPFLRLDFETREGGPATQFYSGAAVYCITPTDEATAKAVAGASYYQPVERWQLPQLEAHATGRVIDSDPDDEEDF